MIELSYESKNNLIEPSDLMDLIEKGNLDKVRILDCSWYLPTDHRVGKELFKTERIPYSQFFDIDDIADKSSCLPHMFPSDEEFIQHMKRLDIRKNDKVICYDRLGVFSAPRAWYLLKLFNLEDVQVLNGGFRKWSEIGLRMETNSDYNVSKLNRSTPNVSDYDYKLDTSKLLSIKDVLNLGKDEQLIDCRCKERFQGVAPEPRPTKRVGHMEGAINICFVDMLTDKWCLKSHEELFKVFSKSGVDLNRSMNFYCGSGLTACVVILAACQLGKFSNCHLYDGSWAEYGNYTEDEINRLKEQIKL